MTKSNTLLNLFDKKNKAYSINDRNYYQSWGNHLRQNNTSHDGKLRRVKIQDLKKYPQNFISVTLESNITTILLISNLI